MISHSRELPNDHRIVLTSDWHIGLLASNAEVYSDALRRGIDRNTFIALGGDLVEGRSSDNKFYEVPATDKEQPLPVQQAIYVRGLLRPYAKKILFGLIGNHERDMIRRCGNIYREIIYDPLKIFYGTYTCRLTVNDQKGNLQYRLFYTHGYGTLNSTADDPVRQHSNMILALKRKLKNKSADCAIQAMGHIHKLLVGKPSRTLYLAENEEGQLKQHYMKHPQTASYIHPDYRYYVNTGSALRTYGDGHDTYSELAGYDPVELGYCVIHVKNKEIVDIEKVVV